ncbi:50S ribosomal protein L10 [Frankliniella fusca]|uniref:50S ribosomal protein L10 n=1 Tax=Frankliniella fusca TaxID=407009 RepID=A0AAE1LHV4_9NEOP|nr:50S ribosomal protein L10 [Frankliniella fusca]
MNEDINRQNRYAANRNIVRRARRELLERRRLDLLRNPRSDPTSSSSTSPSSSGSFEANCGDFSDASHTQSSEDSSSPHESQDNEDHDVPYGDPEYPEPSESEQDDEEEEDLGVFVANTLRRWTLNKGPSSMRKLDELLLDLSARFPNLPLSYKTLLQTPVQVPLTQLNNGSTLWYNGIRVNLDALDLREYVARNQTIKIDVNIDGLPISKTSPLKCWPILGRLAGSLNPPFTSAVYFGRKDPTDVYEYLMDFALEVDMLQREGYYINGNLFPVEVNNYIMDAPARALVKCSVQFNAVCSCDKCCVEGEYIDNRMTFTNLNADLRTDESFLNQTQERHHMGRSPLEFIGTKMVSQFRLDPMHLVYLGVFKRLLTVWLHWNGAYKLHWTAVAAVNDRLNLISSTCPTDFNRPPRSLEFLKLYRAHEFRRMCHYDSILIFRDTLSKNVYEHFLLLYVALYILASPFYVKSQEMRDFAHNLLLIFVEHSVLIYGHAFVVYNVHALIHLVKECEQHGSLDDFSAFPFETALMVLKKKL